MKNSLLIMILLILGSGYESIGQWNTSGNNIYNTNTGNVGIGNNSPTTLLHVQKNMTEPTITIQNVGGSGGATYSMIDNASGANWKFKATSTGGFKIRDNANGLDVFTIESNSSTNAIYIKSGGNVGIGTTTPAGSAALEISSTTKGFLPPRMTTEQRNLISSAATGLTIYNTTKNCNETYNGTSWVSNTHYIGESYGGGIVFYVYDNGQRGFIAATADQGTGIYWYNGTSRVTGTSGDGLNAGAMNTAIIIATQMADNQNGNFAAKVCADYSVTVGGITYGDWYLPSKHELNLLYLEEDVFGGLDNYFYWSSSEYDANHAWYQDFYSGEQNYIHLKNLGMRVRAVRAF